MRVIWSKTPSTSGYIIETLGDSNDWSPTTIKTLLGRLVKKNAIGFETKNRTFYYFPILTEEECIKREVKQLIDRVYGGILNRETLHFMFYGSNMKEYIESLSNSLETNYERIIGDLKYDPYEKIKVYIHTNLNRLHSALGVMNGPDWLRAGWNWGILHIVSSDYFKDIPAEKVAVHALAEIIIHNINPLAPYWLHQGIAAYEGKWLDENKISYVLADKIKNNDIPSITELSSNYGAFGDNYGYVYAYTIAEFIVDKFGFDKLGMFLKKPNEFKAIFDLNENEFWEKWNLYLKEKYQTGGLV